MAVTFPGRKHPVSFVGKKLPRVEIYSFAEEYGWLVPICYSHWFHTGVILLNSVFSPLNYSNAD